MPDQYFYRNPNGQESGPYDVDECRRMVSVGLIEMNGMVRASDTETWQLVGSVFHGDLAPPPPPPQRSPPPSTAPTQPSSNHIVSARCSRTSYILLAVLPGFFGVVGIHNIVAGYKERGGIQLALSALSWILLLLSFVVGVTICLAFPLSLGLFVWAIIEAVTVKTDSNNVLMPT